MESVQRFLLPAIPRRAARRRSLHVAFVLSLERTICSQPREIYVKRRNSARVLLPSSSDARENSCSCRAVPSRRGRFCGAIALLPPVRRIFPAEDVIFARKFTFLSGPFFSFSFFRNKGGGGRRKRCRNDAAIYLHSCVAHITHRALKACDASNRDNNRPRRKSQSEREG